MSEWQEQRRRRDRARRDEVLAFPVLPLSHHGVIAGEDGDVIVCASVGPGGEMVAVWLAAGDLAAVTPKTLSSAGASSRTRMRTRP